MIQQIRLHADEPAGRRHLRRLLWQAVELQIDLQHMGMHVHRAIKGLHGLTEWIDRQLPPDPDDES